MSEQQIRVTLVDDRGFEFHMRLSPREVRAILSHDTPSWFLEVPVPDALSKSITHQYLETSRIARLWLSDELPPEKE